MARQWKSRLGSVDYRSRDSLFIRTTVYDAPTRFIGRTILARLHGKEEVYEHFLEILRWLSSWTCEMALTNKDLREYLQTVIALEFSEDI